MEILHTLFLRERDKLSIQSSMPFISIAVVCEIEANEPKHQKNSNSA